MKIISSNFSHFIFDEDVGKQFFLYGIVFLPSILPLGLLLLLISLFISFNKTKNFLFNDSINIYIFFGIGLIFFSTLGTTLFNQPLEIEAINRLEIWINIMYWIVILLSYIGFQYYLVTEKDKLNFTKFLIIGTIPIIISCFSQIVFNGGKDFQFLNGLVIWFQKPLEEMGGVAGLFSNKNFTGTWLSATLPFTFILINKNSSGFFKKKLSIALTFIFIFLIFSTNSRNAFFSSILSALFFYGIKKLIIVFFIISILLSSIFLLLYINPFINQIFLDIYGAILTKIGIFNFSATPIRISWWKSAIELISKRPLLGWGAGSFAIIYNLKSNSNNMLIPQHTHNLPIELAFNFGIPISLFLSFIIIKIVYDTLINFNQKSISKKYIVMQKAWLASSFAILFINLSDITIYEGKIGILAAVIFAGLRTFIKPTKLIN